MSLIAFLLAAALWSLTFLADALVVTNPCCHVFAHRGAMFGPELPTKGESLFNYLPERKKIASIEGVLKLTPEDNPLLCNPKYPQMKDNFDFQNSIALIPRGGCSFAEKVYFAQLLNAKAAIVFESSSSSGSFHHRSSAPSFKVKLNSDSSDSTSESSSSSESFKAFGHSEDDDVVVMAEDSKYGPLINIPSIFVSYNTWKQLQLLHLTLSKVSFNSQTSLKEKDNKEGIELLKDIYVIINETGSLSTSGPDALPVLWDSMIFLVKVFLIIWSVMGFAYVSNWIKLRYKRYQRQNVIRNLPVKKYKQIYNSNKSNWNKKYSKLSTTETLAEHKPEETNVKSEVKPENTGEKETEAENLLSEINIKVGNTSAESEALSQEFEFEFDFDNCVICLCEFESEDTCTVLPCKHVYHSECIEPWLVNKSSLCPMCKQSIFKNGESRSINEINTEEEENEHRNMAIGGTRRTERQEEERRGSIALSIGMFMVIILTFTFMVVDDDK